jgi:predicted MFS family arabinose efflux permease
MGLGWELVRLIMGHVFLHAGMAGMRMAAPLLALREGYSAAAVGLLLSLFALATVFLALPAGRFADRRGLRVLVALGITVASGGAGLAAIWPVFPVLCLAAVLTGGATGGVVIALQRHVGRIAEGPTQLRQAFSWLAIGPAISNFIGPFLAGILIDNGGFRLAFLAMALLPLITWFWVRTARDFPPSPIRSSQTSGTTWNLLREPGFRRLIVVNWVVATCWDVHTFIVPVLGHEYGLSASVIGSIMGAFALAATAVRGGLPVIASRVREWQVIVVAMGCAVVVFAVYPLVRSPLAIGACSVFLGMALGSVQPMVMSTLHQVTPVHLHGEALGLRLMSINVSSVLMPLVMGAAGAAIGIAGVFWALGALVAATTPLAARLRVPPGPP